MYCFSIPIQFLPPAFGIIWSHSRRRRSRPSRGRRRWTMTTSYCSLRISPSNPSLPSLTYSRSSSWIQRLLPMIKRLFLLFLCPPTLGKNPLLPQLQKVQQMSLMAVQLPWKPLQVSRMDAHHTWRQIFEKLCGWSTQISATPSLFGLETNLSKFNVCLSNPFSSTNKALD